MKSASLGETPKETTPSERVIRFVSALIFGFFVILVLTIGSCSMHNHVYESDVIAAETKKVAEQAKVDIAKYTAEQAKIETIKQMVERGVNPVAANCAVEGVDPSNHDVCLAVGINIGNKEVSQ